MADLQKKYVQEMASLYMKTIDTVRKEGPKSEVKETIANALNEIEILKKTRISLLKNDYVKETVGNC